ncbi:MAG: hypothetical protein ACK496_09195, partial [Acidobacteriota bacterium]
NNRLKERAENHDLQIVRKAFLTRSRTIKLCNGMSASSTKQSTVQKRGPMVWKTKNGKETKLMVLTDGAGPPLGIHVEKTSPSEVKLAEQRWIISE